jgi:hypothetical protein
MIKIILILIVGVVLVSGAAVGFATMDIRLLILLPIAGLWIEKEVIPTLKILATGDNE